MREANKCEYLSLALVPVLLLAGSGVNCRAFGQRDEIFWHYLLSHAVGQIFVVKTLGARTTPGGQTLQGICREQELVGIAKRNPCDPPLSAEVIRSIARGTYKNPAMAAAIAKAQDEMGLDPGSKNHGYGVLK